MAEDPITAFALLTSDDVTRLGSSLQKVYPIESLEGFDDLLEALDQLEQTPGESLTDKQS